jgi:poly-gamma-glutamate synthesis protein (capsule biosynthesis protein)
MRLLLVGDVMLGRLVNQAMLGRPPGWVWQDTLTLFESADWRACNLECVLTHRRRPAHLSKAFHFRSDPGNIRALTAAGFNAVSIANNHVLDFGSEALIEMIARLDACGIRHAGAGRDIAEASRPAVSHVGGVRIGLLAATDNEPAWAASEDKPGVFHVPASDGSAMKKGYLVPAVEGGWDPPLGHRSLADALIEAGADVVYGHSAHVFRGIEIKRGRPVIYSAGDFVDDYAVDEYERNDWALVLVVETQGRRLVHLRLRPALISGCRTRLAEGAEAEPILYKAAELCRAEGTNVEVRGEEAVIALA